PNPKAAPQTQIKNHLIASSIKLLSKDCLTSACLALPMVRHGSPQVFDCRNEIEIAARLLHASFASSHPNPSYSRLTAHAYLITLFARSSTWPGIVRPICFAAFKLITNSNFVACCTGKSPGWTFQDLVHVNSRAPIEIIEVRPIGHEAALIDKFPLEVNSRQPVFGGKL